MNLNFWGKYYLPPSRQILRDNIDERFNYFNDISINNTSELFCLIKDKKKLTELLNNYLFTIEYLRILLRGLKSTHPKPNKISEFQSISTQAVKKRLYNKITNKHKRQKLSEATQINNEETPELTKHTDL